MQNIQASLKSPQILDFSFVLTVRLLILKSPSQSIIPENSSSYSTCFNRCVLQPSLGDLATWLIFPLKASLSESNYSFEKSSFIFEVLPKCYGDFIHAIISLNQIHTGTFILYTNDRLSFLLFYLCGKIILS